MLVVVAREASNKKQNQRMVTMVILLVVVFTVCTGFQHLYFFIHEYGQIKFKLSTQVLLYALSNYVVSLQAAINPIIYGTLRRDFKKAFIHSLVIILIKLKLHKGLLKGHQDEHNFAGKVLTTYFSESHSKKHTDSDVKEVEAMFQKKKLENKRAAKGDSYYYSCVDSPLIGERRVIKKCDSPSISESGNRNLSGSGNALVGTAGGDSPRVEGRHLIKSLGGHNTSFRESPLMTNKCFHGGNVPPQKSPITANKNFHKNNDSSPSRNDQCYHLSASQQFHTYFDKNIQSEDINQRQRSMDICNLSADYDTSHKLQNAAVMLEENSSNKNNHLNNTDSPQVYSDLSTTSDASCPAKIRKSRNSPNTFSVSRSPALGGRKRIRKDSIFKISTNQYGSEDDKTDARVHLLSYKDIQTSTFMLSAGKDTLTVYDDTRTFSDDDGGEIIEKPLIVSDNDRTSTTNYGDESIEKRALVSESNNLIEICKSMISRECQQEHIEVPRENRTSTNERHTFSGDCGYSIPQKPIPAPGVNEDHSLRNNNIDNILHKFPNEDFIQTSTSLASTAVVMPESRSPALQIVHKNLAEIYRNNLYSVSDRGYVSGGSSSSDDSGADGNEDRNNRKFFL